MLRWWDARSVRGEPDQRQQIKRDLVLLFLLALGLRTVWLFLIPPWASPDEPAHFTYAAHIAEQGEVPSRHPQSSYPDISNEVGESWTLTYLTGISGLGQKAGGDLDHLPVHRSYGKVRRFKTDPQNRLTAAGASATGYPPVYYAGAAAFYGAFIDAPLLVRMYALRFWSALLGAASCIFVYLFAFELRKRRDMALAAGLVAAFLPMHAFISASVNNDAAMYLCSSCVCFLAARAVNEPTPTPKLYLWLGVWCGLILVTKPTGAPLLLAVAGLVLIRAFPVRLRPLGFDLARARVLGSALLGLLLIESPWFVFKWQVARAARLENTTEAEVMAALDAPGTHSLSEYLTWRFSLGSDYYDWLMIKTYWGHFGWLEVSLPERSYDYVWYAYCLAFFGLLLRYAWARPERALLTLAIALVAVHTLGIFGIADYAMVFRRTGNTFGLQGRYFHAALAPFVTLLVVGWGAYAKDHPWVYRLLPLPAWLLQVESLRVMIATYYGVGFG